MNRGKVAVLWIVVAAWLLGPSTGWCQAERIKGKAKDLKKQVEGKGSQTNAPAKKPAS